MTKKLTEFYSFDKNPFLEEIFEADIIKSKDQKVTIPTNLSVKDYKGNHISNVFVKKNQRKFSDIRDFVRIPAEGFRMLATMEKTEIKILCYIFENLQYGELKIEISIEDIKLFYGYVSRNPIYAGIIGLLDKNIIARKKDSKSEYYLNPIFFYKGSIVAPFFDYLKVRYKLSTCNFCRRFLA